MEGKLQVVFLGTSAFGLPALHALSQAGHRISAVVTQPDRPRGRGRRTSPSPIKDAAETLGLPVMQPERVGEFGAELADLSPDVLVSAAYGQFMTSAVRRSPRIAALNIHASLLPCYRGAAPIQWAVINGEKETGITVFRIISKMDAGPILASRAVPIGETETAGELEERLTHVGADLIVEVLEDLPAILAGQQPQDETRVTYAPKLEKKDGRLSFDSPLRSILNRVRGLQPRPGAYGDLQGEIARRVRILEVAPAGDPPEAAPPSGLEPGTIAAASDEGITVAVKDGLVLITRIQPEGGKPMPAADYLRGHPVAPGDRFV